MIREGIFSAGIARSQTILVLCLLTLAGCDRGGGQPTITEAVLPDWHEEIHRATPVGFVAGQTALAVEGTLPGGEMAGFIVSAHEGDYLIAHVLSPNEDFELSVLRLDDGTRLADVDGNSSYWSGEVPVTAGYLIRLKAPAEAAPYALEIEMPRRIILDVERAEARVKATVSSHTPAAYRVWLEAGIEINLEVVAAEGQAELAIRGEDGQTLVSWESGKASFEGVPPRSQNYLIHMLPVNGTTELTLEIKVES